MRLFAFFDVLNWSLNKKVYIILKFVKFPIQRSHFILLLHLWDQLYNLDLNFDLGGCLLQNGIAGLKIKAKKIKWLQLDRELDKL